MKEKTKIAPDNVEYSQRVNTQQLEVTQITNPLLISYFTGRSKLFSAEFPGSSVYEMKASAYDLQKGTSFCVAYHKNKHNENEVVGGIAACIKSEGQNLPIFKKYSEYYNAIKLMENIGERYKTAEIYGAWRDPDFGGLGITEELYKKTYSKLKEDGVEVVVATLTPKNVDGYLRQAKASDDKFKTFVVTGVNIQVINTEGETKPRVAVISTCNPELIMQLSKDKNFTEVEKYINDYTKLQKNMSQENNGEKIKPASIIEMLASQIKSTKHTFNFLQEGQPLQASR